MREKLLNRFTSSQINRNDFIVSKNSNLFIGGLTGRTGTTWLTQLLTNLLGAEYCIIGEHGAFVLSQFRNAGYEFYQVTPGTVENRKRYLNYFYEFVITQAYDRTNIYGKEGLKGLSKIVPKRAIEIAFEFLEEELENAQTLSECNVCFGNFYSCLLNYHSVQQKGTLNWISKEPPYGRHLEDLYNMIPNCRVVISTRDGRDTALSMAKRGWGNGDIIQCMDRWGTFTRMTVNSLERVPSDNYLLVKYRDLVLQFKENVQKILDFYNISSVNEIVNSIDVANYKYAPLKDNFDKWKDELSSKENLYFEKNYGYLMNKLGYEV